MPHKPAWFRNGSVVISDAPTCGINKDGSEQFTVDPATGHRLDQIDDKLYADAELLAQGITSGGYVFTRALDEVVSSGVLVPRYHDYSSITRLRDGVRSLPGFTCVPLGQLVSEGWVILRKGHGSPSADQRLGNVPYIKVSDLRAGHVNVNPTNLVPLELAHKFWRGDNSGLQAYDLISPERASKNIGEFCVLMPGQEQVVLTKEVIVLRSTARAPFDQFYLLWALSLEVVREQWNRIILMQTNREDVGDRALEIVLPIPPDRVAADKRSAQFREYYATLEQARSRLGADLRTSPLKHHFFIE